MLFRSCPSSPAARALLGDTAVQKNASNRAYPILNSAMDATFNPAHAAWRILWNQQQVVANQVAEAKMARDEAVKRLTVAIRRVFRALQGNLGTESPTLKQYLPGGSLQMLQTGSCSKKLSQLAPYVAVISVAADAVIPLELRSAFAVAYTECQSQEAVLQGALQRVIEARKKRDAQDLAWDFAYKSYHRAVEYEMGGDRQKIQMFLKLWPVWKTFSAPAEAPALVSTSPAAAKSSD